jgi:Cell division protein 48 (CDC48), N-terminal domain.
MVFGVRERVNELELKVGELRHNEAGRGRVRIDEEAMEQLGLTAGDAVEIEGRRKTVAIVWPGYSEDRGTGLIRWTGGRENAG